MKQLNFNDVAVFLLATTTSNRFFEQDYRSYYHSRILPIRETWGSYFPDLYFVFGTNTYDHAFLKQRCVLESTVGVTEALPVTQRQQQRQWQWQRQLKAREPQTPSRDAVDHFRCPVHAPELRLFTNHTASDLPLRFDGTAPRNRLPVAAVQVPVDTTAPISMHWNALFIANCTGEYFGIGPTCRCQEAMRYFFTREDYFGAKQWFLFMDDDIYVRPFALLSFLEEALFNASGVSVLGENPVPPPAAEAPMALLAPLMYRGFTFSSAQMRRRGFGPKARQHMRGSDGAAPVDAVKHNCSSADEYKFAMAQPAFINRAAMDALRIAIDSDALIRLHRLWGGSHDSVLGMLLWMYRTPSYSFARAYCGHQLYQSTLDPALYASALRKMKPHRMFIFHRIVNFRGYGRTKPPEWRFTHASQYWMADLLGDTIIYNHSGAGIIEPHHRSGAGAALTTHRAQRAQQQQQQQQQRDVGRDGARYLIKLQSSGVSDTIFAPYADQLHARYVDFTPDHCVLLSAAAAEATAAAPS